MKTTRSIYKYIFIIICILGSIHLHAQTISITLNVTAGNLSTLLGSKKDSIASLTLSGNINGDDISAIRNMTKLTSINIMDVNIVEGGSFTADGTTKTTKNNQMPQCMFSNLTNLTSIIIPKSINTISELAFNNCSQLTSFVIPNNITIIGDFAFAGCTKLSSITIPNSITSINYAAFINCIALTSISIPGSVTSIGKIAFENCKGLISISIPTNVAFIGEDAFSGCSSLKEYIVSENNITYSSYEGVLFNKNKDKLIYYPNAKLNNSYIIPSSVTTIGDFAFAGCTKLNSITIPNSMTSISQNAFRNFTGLTSVIIPSSITAISYGGFWGCSGLTTIDIPNSIDTIGNFAFADCTGLKSISIPTNVSSIGYLAFYDCTKLTSITVPDSIATINYGGFWGCTALSSFIIPNGVSSISDGALAYCTGLKEISCKALTPPYAPYTYTFNNIDKTTCKVYVPKGTSTAYKNAIGWSAFTNIIEETSTDISPTQTNNTNFYIEQNTIILTGIETGNIISIYNESGALVQKTKVSDDTVRINVPSNHIYLIKTPIQTFKVAL